MAPVAPAVTLTECPTSDVSGDLELSAECTVGSNVLVDGDGYVWTVVGADDHDLPPRRGDVALLEATNSAIGTFRKPQSIYDTPTVTAVRSMRPPSI